MSDQLWAGERFPRLDPIPAPSTRLGHPYTVDVYLHGCEPYPCVICGQGRQAHDDEVCPRCGDRPHDAYDCEAP